MEGRGIPISIKLGSKFELVKTGGIMNNKTSQERSGFLFNVDILIDGSTNAQALQSLLALLNASDKVVDLRVNSGLELGQIIEASLSNLKTNYVEKSRAGLSSAKGLQIKHAAAAESALKAAQKAAQPVSASPPASFLTPDDIRDSISKNRLVRLIVNKPGGTRLSIPCRILNFDEAAQMLSVYHVDEKQVYSFSLNEIDELTGQ
ncbi:hypothetical protein [Saccharibacillus endophyticus]|uniref:Uncharacterized protein n=1 Tax=Saccharibacillus endophyticus TaxID=2060666 RepID=A0ABQ2A658_9BACL|nr:hypothetical protein [Saccharibacillus endophyticus]GGH85095.1 hypothetical protein GCM10007362_41720 [Saccharibacillus endophyticus]